MNNNFSFNYKENDNKKLVEVIKDEDIKTNNEVSNKDVLKEKKYKNIFILVFGFAVMIILFVTYGLKGGGLESLSNSLDNINNNEDKNKDDVSSNETIVLNDKYIIEAKINYKENNKEYSYLYTISKEDDMVYIAKEYNNKIDKYIYTNNEYYQLIDTNAEDYQYNIIKEELVFDIIDYKYLNIGNINNYILKGNIQYTTNHANNTKEIKYNVLLKDILYKNNTEDYIEILYKYNDSYNLEINYINLMKYYNNKYENFNIVLNIINSK